MVSSWVFRGIYLQPPKPPKPSLLPPFPRMVSSWVTKVTSSTRCRLVDMTSIIPAADVGDPMYFVSHAWANPFSMLVDVVSGFLQHADDSTRVWLDFVAVNEHPVQQVGGEAGGGRGRRGGGVARGEW